MVITVDIPRTPSSPVRSASDIVTSYAPCRPDRREMLCGSHRRNAAIHVGGPREIKDVDAVSASRRASAAMAAIKDSVGSDNTAVRLTGSASARLGLLVGEHFLATFLERVERAGGDLLGVALLHIEAPAQIGIQETDVQGEYLNTLVAHIEPQCVGEAPGSGFRGRIGGQHRTRKPGDIGEHVDDRSAAICQKDRHECLTCANDPVEVGLENLARAVDHLWIERTGIDAPDPRVIDQQCYIVATDRRRTDDGGIGYVELDRYNARQINALRMAYASIELFHAAPD